MTITVATTGAGISADTAANAITPSWTSLNTITISEGNNGDFAQGTNVTLILKAPSGFQFNTAVTPDISFTTGKNITTGSATVSDSSTLTVKLTVIGANAFDTLRIGSTNGLQVRPTLGTPLASGQIYRPVSGGGTATISGITSTTNTSGLGGSSFAPLGEVAGNVTRMVFSTQPGSANAGEVFSVQPVIKTQDQFGTFSSRGLPTDLFVTNRLTSGTGTLSGNTIINIGAGGGNGTATYTNLSIDTGGTGKQLTAAAPGFTNVASSLFSVNARPVISAIADQTANEDTAPLTISFNVSDQETPANGLTLSVNSSNTNLVANANLALSGASSSRTLTISVPADAFGTSTIAVMASDGAATTTNSFVLTVNSMNDAPTLNSIGNLTINEDAPSQTNLLSGIGPGAFNETNQTITFTAVSSNPGLIPNPIVTYTNGSSTGRLTFTPVANANGSTVITVIAQDNGGTTNGGIDSVTNTFTVTVTAANDPPTMDPISNVTVNEDSSTQTIELTGISPGPANESGQTITITATSSNTGLIPNPALSYGNLSSTGTLIFTPAPNVSGTATITVIIRDNGGTANSGADSLTNTFTITVADVNDQPTLNPISDVTIYEDSGKQTINLRGITPGQANESSQTITITATSGNTSLIPNPTINYTNGNTTGTLQFTPTTNANGVVTITVVAKDNGGTTNGGIDSVTNTFSVTIIPVNDPPTLGTVANVTINEDAPTQTINLTGISAGPTNETGQSISIMASSSNPALIPDPVVTYTSPNSTGTLTFTPLTNVNGVATITLILQDNGGTASGGNDSLTNAFTITVNPVNDRPTLDPINNVTVLEDAGPQSVLLTGITPGFPTNEANQTITITATSSKSGTVPNPTATYNGDGTGTLVFQSVTNANGNATITVVVKDNGGTSFGGVDSVTNAFTITIVPVNDPPTINPVGTFAVNEDAATQTINLSGISAGPGETGTVTVTMPPTADTNLISSPILNYTNGSSTGTISFKPLTNAFGTTTITLLLHDDGGTDNGGNDTLTNIITVVVNPVDDPPTLNPLTNLTILEDAPTQTVFLSGITAGFPANESNQALTVTAISSNPGLIPNPSITYNSPDPIGSLAFAPTFGSNGTATISVIVQDSGGRTNGGIDSVTNFFTVTVIAVNDPPIMNPLSNLTINEDAGKQTINMSGIAPGPPNESSQTLTLSATSSNTNLVNLTVVFTNGNSTGTLSFTTPTNAFGTSTITVVLKDNGGTTNGGVNSLTNVFTVTVNPVDDAPTLNAISNLTINENANAQTISLSGITVGTAANESNQVLTVTAVSSNTNAIPNPVVNYTNRNATGNLTFTPLPHAFGVVSISVTVQDDGGTANGGIDSVTRTFAVTINPINDRPTLDPIGNVTINEDSAVQTVPLNNVSPGPNETNQTLTLTVNSSNTNLISTPTVNYTNGSPTGSLTFTPATNATGTAIITLILKDNGGTTNGGIDSLTNVFTVNVAPVNDPPTLSALSNLTINEDAPQQTVNLFGITCGPTNETGQRLFVRATSSDISLIPDPTVTYVSPASTGTITFKPATNANGTAIISVSVQDDGGLGSGGNDTVTNTFTVTVNPINDRPTLDPISNVTLNENTSQIITLTGITAGWPNEIAQALAVSAVSSNLALLPNPTINYTSPNSTASLTLSAATNITGSAVVSVIIQDDGGTNNGGQDTFSRQFLVTVNPVTDLAISQTSASALTGLTMSYAITVTNQGPSIANGVMVTNFLPDGATFVSATSSQGSLTNVGNVLICTVGTLTNRGSATIIIGASAIMPGNYTNSATVSSSTPDPVLSNNSTTAIATATAPNFRISNTMLVSESCTNGAIDPAELVTVIFEVQNNNSNSTTNLMATLKPVAGVTQPNPAIGQSYGALSAGGGTNSQSFSFIPSGACGKTFTAALELQDGGVPLGTIVKTFNLGLMVPTLNNFAKTNSITVPSSGAASPYPSTILVSGVNTQVIGLTVTLSNINHTQPDDLDILLVGPHGQKTFLMSDCGGINALSHVNLTFDNSAASKLPDSAQIVSGTYKPTDFQTTTDILPSPAPAGPYVADLSVFTGTDPNGTWQLFVFDDTSGFSGSIAGGWTLNLTTMEPSCCVDTNSADLSLSMSAAADPVVVGNNITFNMTLTNFGPHNATGVAVSNAIPANANFVSASLSQGSLTNTGTSLICNLGTLNNGAIGNLQVVFQPTLPGRISNAAVLFADQPDFVSSNNAATVGATVLVPGISVNDSTVVEGNSGTTTNAAVSIQLSSPSSQSVSVNYATDTISASPGVDYLSTNGTVTFNPGETNKTIFITVLGDSANEATEFFKVVASNPTNATITRSEGICSISDDDPIPALSINDTSTVEGNTGTNSAVFSVTLSNVSGQLVTVNYATSNGTATVNSDYLASSGTLLFNPGETNKTISIPVIGDSVNESNETFFVNLFSAANAIISRSRGTATITNDDFLPSITAVSATLTSESCTPTNGVIDPNETVTVSFALKNSSATATNTSSLVATLLSSGGISSPSAAQNYGVLTNHSGSVSRSFTFTANGSCADTLMAVLQLQDGANNLGMVTNFLFMGKPAFATNMFTNSATINIPDFGPAVTYPSTITVSGVTGSVLQVTASLLGLSHTYPADLDILLTGPGGQNVALMSTAGGQSITNVTLTFNDSSTSSLPALGKITNGTYKPTSYSSGTTLPAPAPAAPYGTNLAGFNGVDPNGDWSLYIYDHTSGDAGAISNGWGLTVTAQTGINCCGASSVTDLSMGMSAPPAVVIGRNLTYSFTITNLGPNTASDLVLSNTLPPNVSFVSASATLGNCAPYNGGVLWTLGTLTNQGHAVVTVTVSTSDFGQLAGSAVLTSRTFDPNPADNNATVFTTVTPPPPTASLTASPVIGLKPLTVSFSDTSIGVITNRAWDFGNGTSTNIDVTNCSAIYNNAGSFSVSLAVTGPGGTSVITRTNYIVVTNGPTQLLVNQPNLDFGGVEIGSSNRLAFQVVNYGAGVLSGSATTASPFQMDGGVPFSIAAGQTSQVFVVFSPDAVGSFSNAVVFSSNGGSSTNAVVGTGLSHAQLIVMPANVDFGAVAIGSSTQLDLIVSNAGGVLLLNAAISIDGGAFAILSDTNFTLPPFMATNITIAFAPTNEGTFSNNVVFMTANAGASTNSLTAIGYTPLSASFSASATNGLAPLTIVFDDHSQGAITNRIWDFGNGVLLNTSLASATNTYTNAGIYTVTLTVQGTAGQSSVTQNNYIFVSASPLIITLIQIDGSNVVLGFSTEDGKTYRVEYTDDLASPDWTILQDDLAGNGGTVQVIDTDSPTGSARYYRIVLLP